MIDPNEQLEDAVVRKATARHRKRKPRMKVSGKSVLTLQRIIVRRARSARRRETTRRRNLGTP